MQNKPERRITLLDMATREAAEEAEGTTEEVAVEETSNSREGSCQPTQPKGITRPKRNKK